MSAFAYARLNIFDRAAAVQQGKRADVPGMPGMLSLSDDRQ